MAGSAQPLDNNYKSISQSFYDPIGQQFVSPLAGTTVTSADGTVYAPHAVQLVDGARATYACSITALASAASATDIFTITGSATKTVRVTRLEISGQATTAASVQVVLVKRSTANTLGTSTAGVAIPYDSKNAAATATVLAYTANPTLGTLVGSANLRAGFLFLGAPGTATVGPDKLAFDLGSRPAQAIVLRGITQVFAVNLNAATVTGGSFDINIEWTEDTYS